MGKERTDQEARKLISGKTEAGSVYTEEDRQKFKEQFFPKQKIALYPEKDLRDKIIELAKAENRSMNNFILTLLRKVILKKGGKLRIK